MPQPDRDGPLRTPVSTYRLQLDPGFGFAEAAALAGYLCGLGVSHACLSPILQAVPGSTHGYDVVDHSRISAELGGEAGFRAMVEEFRRHGLGVIVDIVPNHMAIPAPEWLNRPLWSILRDGPESPYAHWFDVDWATQGGRIVLPVLAGPVEECLDSLVVERSGDLPGGLPVLRYFDHALPLRRGTAGLPLAELLDAQAYQLVSWRASAELNWRRLFDSTYLIAIRVEDPRVFADTHAVLLTLLAEGLIAGLCVDQLDGLADPRGYLRRLAEATGGAWMVADKILIGAEELPPDFSCAGTTGYDTLSAVGGLFLVPGAGALMTGTYVRRTGGADTFTDVAEAARRQAVSLTLAAEVAWLCRLLGRVREPELVAFGAEDLRTVLVELLVAFPVYRAYVMPGEPAPWASMPAHVVARAAAVARSRLPERLHPALRTVGRLVLGRRGGAVPRAGAGTGSGQGEEPDGDLGLGQIRDELVVRFQQICGQVMVTGIEETAFYRWPRLAALNEVGGSPDRFGLSPAEFHALAGRLARDWPTTLTTLSTRYTKWQEDVRARLAVLSEAPHEWASTVAQWHDRAAGITDGPLPQPDTEYLFWQILVGAWPIEHVRMAAFLLKAMREVKIRTMTSWTNPNSEYEGQVLAFVTRVLADPVLTSSIDGFVARIAPDAEANSLGAKLVQLTMPGVASVFQGCELAGFSLVDPDNLRPVDFVHRQQMLAALDAGSVPPGSATPHDSLDGGKLLVTSRAFRLRRDHPEWFAGDYLPLQPEGPAARHAIAFIRSGRSVTVATRLPAGLRRMGGWADTALPLRDGRWLDVLTGASYRGPRLRMSVITKRLPVALLIPADG